MSDNLSVGRKGEDAVASFLMEKGHSILKRNWRRGHLEVDIISADGFGLHFVEIKTRRAGDGLAAPEEKVDARKQKRIVRAALEYLNNAKDSRLGEMEVFFDVATVVIDGSGSVKIRYFPQAYIPYSL